jgi:hypothetical protein
LTEKGLVYVFGIYAEQRNIQLVSGGEEARLWVETAELEENVIAVS